MCYRCGPSAVQNDGETGREGEREGEGEREREPWVGGLWKLFRLHNMQLQLSFFIYFLWLKMTPGHMKGTQNTFLLFQKLISVKNLAVLITLGPFCIFTWLGFHLTAPLQGPEPLWFQQSKVLIEVYLWSARQQEADRIMKIWALLSDDNCFQPRFIHFALPAPSAGRCEGRKRGRESFATAHKDAIFPLAAFHHPRVCSFGPVRFVWSRNLAKQSTFCVSFWWLSGEDRAHVHRLTMPHSSAYLSLSLWPPLVIFYSCLCFAGGLPLPFSVNSNV